MLFSNLAWGGTEQLDSIGICNFSSHVLRQFTRPMPIKIKNPAILIPALRHPRVAAHSNTILMAAAMPDRALHPV